MSIQCVRGYSSLRAQAACAASATNSRPQCCGLVGLIRCEPLLVHGRYQPNNADFTPGDKYLLFSSEISLNGHLIVHLCQHVDIPHVNAPRFHSVGATGVVKFDPQCHADSQISSRKVAIRLLHFLAGRTLPPCTERSIRRRPFAGTPTTYRGQFDSPLSTPSSAKCWNRRQPASTSLHRSALTLPPGPHSSARRQSLSQPSTLANVEVGAGAGRREQSRSSTMTGLLGRRRCRPDRHPGRQHDAGGLRDARRMRAFSASSGVSGPVRRHVVAGGMILCRYVCPGQRARVGCDDSPVADLIGHQPGEINLISQRIPFALASRPSAVTRGHPRASAAAT
jgi:hypothetical protein